MASIRDILEKLLASEAGPPATGAGQYGRAGGAGPGPVKPIAGVQTRMAGPVSQRNYGPEVSETPTPEPTQPITRAAATPPPAAISQALRAPSLQGTDLESPQEDIQEGGEQMEGVEQETPQEDMAEGGQEEPGEQSPIDLGTLPPIQLGGPQQEEDAQLEMAAKELARRMLEARGRR